MLLAAVSNTPSVWTLAGAPRIILVILLGGVTILTIATWAMWLAGVGRFKPNAADATTTNGSRIGPWQWLQWFFTTIIDDFRNFLALVLMGIFLIAMVLMLWPSLAYPCGTYDNLKDGLQTVVACLGGLVGSIIGYYFGESAAAKANTDDGTTTPGTPTQGPLPPGAPPATPQSGAPASTASEMPSAMSAPPIKKAADPPSLGTE
ncbi:MAG: hypothetical protein KF902_14670 [Phycisphaeraceae bacterium]|nr:hypothetical protein [Phycisphaeraceae bacterium]